MVHVEGDEIVIRIPVSVLESTLVVPDDLRDVRGRPTVEVTNARLFADAFITELDREYDELGSTLLTDAFEAAFEQAYENGADGIEATKPIAYEPYVAPLTEGPAG
jgi:hypothetical protein